MDSNGTPLSVCIAAANVLQLYDKMCEICTASDDTVMLLMPMTLAVATRIIASLKEDNHVMKRGVLPISLRVAES